MKKLNKFEKTDLFSARAAELAAGAAPMVKLPKELEKKALLNNDYVKIAELEYEAGKLELEVVK